MQYTSGKHYTCIDVYNLPLQGIITTLTTNTVGPLIVAKHFAPLLQKGGGGFGQQPAERAKQHSGIIVNITAKVGSIGDNGIIRWSYCLFLWMLFANVIIPCRSGWLVQLQNV